MAARAVHVDRQGTQALAKMARSGVIGARLARPMWLEAVERKPETDRQVPMYLFEKIIQVSPVPDAH